MASHCVGHEPCPKCGSRDNLARYADGGAFCFGRCGYYEPADVFKAAPVVERPEQEPYPKDATFKLPDANVEWLSQYLEKWEINQHFQYSPKLDRHLYRHVEDGREYWEGRSVIKLPGGKWGYKNPKSLSYGNKPYVLFGDDPTRSTVVLVEDVVSAIKVSRVATALPLFGASLALLSMMYLLKDTRLRKVIIWLDADKYDNALKIAEKIHQFKPVGIISTEKDPKAQSEEELEYLIGRMMK